MSDGPDAASGCSNADTADSDFSDRHIRIETRYCEVVVRDDRRPLEDLEAAACRLLDRAETQHCELSGSGDQRREAQ